MRKKAIILMIIFIFMLVNIPVMAADQPVEYKATFTVGGDGGRFQVGFTNVEFKKDFLVSDKLPATFTVEIYAENGVAYIEFSPNTPEFAKKVHIRADAYNGYLYDRAAGKNIQVDIKKQQILAEHFSRYAYN